MEIQIRYPVGVQSFTRIREGGYLHVDKTAISCRLVNTCDCVFFSRPRRFGKILLMSTLEAYLKGRRELFEDLEIEKLENDWNEYPVLRVDLSTESFTEMEHLLNHLNLILSEWEEIYGRNENERGLGSRFSGVIRRAYRHSGRRVVILIDVRQASARKPARRHAA